MCICVDLIFFLKEWKIVRNESYIEFKLLLG